MYMKRAVTSVGISAPSGPVEWESGGQIRELSGRWLSQVGLHSIALGT